MLLTKIAPKLNQSPACKQNLAQSISLSILSLILNEILSISILAIKNTGYQKKNEVYSDPYYIPLAKRCTYISNFALLSKYSLINDFLQSFTATWYPLFPGTNEKCVDASNVLLNIKGTRYTPFS